MGSREGVGQRASQALPVCLHSPSRTQGWNWLKIPRAAQNYKGWSHLGPQASLLGLGDATFCFRAGCYVSLVQILGAGTWWQDMFQQGLLKSGGRGQGWGSVSGQQGIPTFAGGGGGALLHRAPHPQAAPRCPLTRELGMERLEVAPRQSPLPHPPVG